MRSLVYKVGRKAKTYIRDRTASIHADPIVVFGNPKSGTTAIANLLAEASGRSYSHDMFYRRSWKYTADLYSGELSFEQVMRSMKSEFSAGVVKEPNLTFVVPQVVKALPQARNVFVVRSAADNIRSILSRLKIPGTVHDIEDVNDYPEMVRAPQWQEMLDPRPLGLEPGTHIEIIAQRWRRAVDAYLDISDHCVLVHYEAFRADKKATIETCLKDCGVPVVNDISEKVDVQFQPAGDRGELEAFFSPENLALIQKICGPVTEKLVGKNHAA